MYNSRQDQVAEEVACRASNSLQQIVQVKRIELASGMVYRFFTTREVGCSWPAELVQEGQEAVLAAAVVSALSPQSKKPANV